MPISAALMFFYLCLCSFNFNKIFVNSRDLRQLLFVYRIEEMAEGNQNILIGFIALSVPVD